MNIVIIWIINILSWLLLGYAISISLAYLSMAMISIGETIRYKRKNRKVDYESSLGSPFAPTVSILIPAYNEETSIVASVRSLLSLNYGKLDVIVINDGSTDDTLKKLCEAYDLKERPVVANERIPTRQVTGMYVSTHPSFQRLVVVDKENGGKADALNVGLNLSQSDLVACVDADCIFEPDAMMKMVKPFLEPGEEKVIATGGVIRIANSCVFKGGKLEKVVLPKNFLAKAQTLEYIRAFLLARMGWSKLNGLLIISGAFGLFDREIAIRAGGYEKESIGEDMELVVRMRMYMHENKLPYKVKYIPDPLCWTEVPETTKMLHRQRNRWTRGTIDTLLRHKKVLFNPKYGVLGMLSAPYWLLFEWFGPILEFLGILMFIYLVIIQSVHWPIYFVLLGFVYSVHLTISATAILMEERTFSQYGKFKDMFKLMMVALVEPLIYHPMTLWFSMRGNIAYLFNKKSWGKQNRIGFKREAEPATSSK